VVNPPKNNDHCMLSGYIGSQVSYVHNFNNITPMFSDHISNISVPENNVVMLPKPQMKDAQVSV
jgi:hypothetical protein